MKSILILFIVIFAIKTEGFTYIGAPVTSGATWLIWTIIAIVVVIVFAPPYLKKLERKQWARQLAQELFKKISLN